MAFQVLTDAKLYIDGYDLSGHSNQLALKHAAEILDDTVFGATSKSRVAGLKDVELTGGGFFEANSAAFKSDDVINAKLAVADTLVTVCPTAAAAGDVAFFFPALLAEYSPGGEVGQLMVFEINASGCNTLARGTVLENAAKTATANGTAQELGEVTASQKLYAAMHVLAVSGTNPTLDLVVQSDSAEAFTSAADRITFSQKTAVGSEWATPVSGAITDTWWRASWTLGGTSPSFTVAVIVAIQ